MNSPYFQSIKSSMFCLIGFGLIASSAVKASSPDDVSGNAGGNMSGYISEVSCPPSVQIQHLKPSPLPDGFRLQPSAVNLNLTSVKLIQGQVTMPLTGQDVLVPDSKKSMFLARSENHSVHPSDSIHLECRYSFGVKSLLMPLQGKSCKTKVDYSGGFVSKMEPVLCK